MALALIGLLPLSMALTQLPDTSQNLLVGVLEEPQCLEDASPSVRILFTKADTGWVTLSAPLPIVPVPGRQITWHIAFDGRPLGTFRTVAPNDDYFIFLKPRDSLLRPVPGTTLPMVSNKAGVFTGWCKPPSRRPLVVVSKPRVADPDHWKPLKDTSGLTKTLLPAFRSVVPKVDHCPHDPEEGEPFHFTAAHIQVVRAYRNIRGNIMAGLQLDPATQGCDGPDTEEWYPHWFRIGNGVAYLGAGLTLVDAGDYDGDGTSEILFWYTGYDMDGYSLYFGTDTAHVDYRWSYH